MKKIVCIFLSVLLGAVCLCGCAGTGGDSERGEETEKREVQLLKDKTFSKGFNLSGIVSYESGSRAFDYLNYGGKAGTDPAWRLAQWGSRFNLALTDELMTEDERERFPASGTETEKDGIYTYSDDGLTFDVDPQTGYCKMFVNGKNEYPVPRVANQAWPHLLVEQTFSEYHYLKDFEHLYMKLRFRINFCTMEFERISQFDASLHSAQITWFVTPQNVNEASEGKGEMLWFGLPIFDYRRKDSYIDLFYAQDGGKEDSTGQFIYSLCSRDYLGEGNIIGKEIEIVYDILPGIKAGLEMGKQQGYLPKTSYEDLALTTTNLGWEVTGTFNASFEIFDMQIFGELKQ